MALLIGFGAAAVNPYLALDSIDDMISEGLLEGVSPRQARRNYIKAACKGVLKVMSKMGISTVASYTGAQVFEAIGLDGALIDEYFTGTVGRIGGVGLSVLAAEVADAPPRRPTSRGRPSGPTASSRWAASTSGGARASSTSSTPRRCSSCSTPRGPSATTSSRSTRTAVDDQAEKLGTLRGLLRLKPAPGGPDPDRRGRADLVDHDPLLHRRHVLRLHLGRGARDARHRHEPASAAAPTPARAARTPTATRPTPTATCAAAPSSRWPRAASA